MAANDGEHPVTETFPGIHVPSGTGAMGSAGASGRAADAQVTDVTPATGASQDAYAASAGTLQPGQNEGFPGGADSGAYTSTGAGHGNPNPHRHPNGA
jgi:hypothetical protein